MANYTAVAAGGAWNVSTTWSPAGVPGAADTAILNSSSGNVTVPAAGATCATLTLTGYTGTLLLSGNLTIATSGLNLGSFTGTINFSAGDIILPDGLFNLGNASVYTTLGTGGVLITKPSASFSIYNINNKIWNCKFALGAAGTTSPTIYFEDNPLEVTGLVSFQATTTGTINLISADIFTPNLIFLKISGNFTLSGSSIYRTSTSGQNLGITGSNNQTFTGSGTHQLRSPLRIDKTGGTLSLTGTINYNSGTLTYVQGTVNSGTSTLMVATATTTFNTNGSSASGATTTSSTGINWYNVTSYTTMNLTSNFTCLGTFTSNSGATLTKSASEIFYLGGNLAVAATLTSTSTEIIMNGTGTWSGSGAVAAPLTINTSGTITISGSVVFQQRTLTYIAGTGTVITTGSTLYINASYSCTINTNGINWNNVSTYSSILNITSTITLSSNWNIIGTLTFDHNTNTINFSTGSNLFNPTGNLSMGSSSGTVNLPNNINVVNVTYGAATINSNNIYISGNLTCFNNGFVSGTSTLILNGTGTWSQGANSGRLAMNLKIDTTGIITISGGVIYGYGSVANRTLTYVQGTVITTGSTLIIEGPSCSFDTNTMFWNNITLPTVGTPTLTILSDLNLNGNLTTGGSITACTINGLFNINVKGNLTINYTTRGTSTIILNGTGSQIWSAAASFSNLSNNLTIDKASGTLTIGTNVFYITGLLKYINGNVDTSTNSSTLNISGCTLESNGIIWYNIRTFNSVITLNNDLVWSNIWTSSDGGAISYSGIGSLAPISTASVNFSNGTTITLKNNIQITDATLAATINTNTINISGNLLVSNTTLGNTNLILNGTSSQSWTHSSAVYLANNITIDKSGILNLVSNIYYRTGILTYIKGIVITKNSTLNLTSATTLLNCNKINFDRVVITSGITVTMNEFFSGSPTLKTTITSSSTGVYNITFTDNFEKIAKFVKLTNFTTPRRNQLLMLTNIPDKRTNIGIRYFNNLPNGVAKNEPSVFNQSLAGPTLVGDPAMIVS